MFVGLVSVGAWNGAHLRPHVPPARLRVWRFAVIMNTGENKESGSVDGSRFGDLWSEFSVDQDDESEGGQLLGDSDDDEAWVDELPDVEWDEPEGDENDEPNGRPVLGVGNYMEVLMQKKYGDDWELLLADANLQWGLEAAADEPSYVDEVAHGVGEEVDDDDDDEEELRAMVARQSEQDELAEEVEASAALAADPIPLDEDFSYLASSSPEALSLLSPRLSEFVSEQRDASIPEPFPASEVRFLLNRTHHRTHHRTHINKYLSAHARHASVRTHTAAAKHSLPSRHNSRAFQAS